MTKVIEICKAFDRVANQYEKASIVQQEIGQRLLNRLDFLKISPQRILDLGCGVGRFSKALKKKYPNAHVVGIDLSHQMLKIGKSKQSWRTKWGLICGDISTIPFANECFDLVFSNQVIHWVENGDNLFSELHRIMAENACLMFSTLGPDTFKELNSVFRKIDDYAHVNTFHDMHDIGDLLLQKKFIDPVMDMEFLTARYGSVTELLQSLKRQGVKNIHSNRKRGLSGRQFLQQISFQYQQQFEHEGKIPLSYEVVYGHAWRNMTKNKIDKGETFIPVSAIKKQRSKA